MRGSIIRIPSKFIFMKIAIFPSKCIGIVIYLSLFISIAEAVTKTGTITADETWSGVIEITGFVTIGETATVTVNPGTIIKFGTNYRISVDGTFIAIGTVGSKINFTSILDDSLGGDTNGDGGATTPAAGDWARIENVTGHTANTSLEHVVIKYGGSSSSAVIFVGSGKYSIDDVSIMDCSTAGVLVSGNAVESYDFNNLSLERIGTTTSHYGVGVINTNAVVTSTNLTTVDVAGRHVSITKGPHTWRSSGTSFSGGGIKAIEIRGGTITGDEVFDAEVPYLLTAELIIADGGSLTIPPGTIVFAETAGKIKNQGKLNAIGTAESPIIFTSLKDDTVGGDANGDADATSPAAQDWQGIQTDFTTSVTRLEHCEFSYGGGSQNTTIYALRGLTTIEDCLIQFSESRAVFISAGDAILRNNTFTDAASTGVYMRNSQGYSILENNHFENCVTGVYAWESGVELIASGTTAVNCGNTNAVKFVDTTGSLGIDEDQIWQEELLYYVTRDVIVAAGVSWTIAPGTLVKFAAGNRVTINGDLSAVGTEDSPIQFTSILDDSIGGDTNEDAEATTPVAGDWAGLVVRNNGSIELDYVEMYYGGKVGAGSTALVLDGTTEFSITNSTFAYSELRGIWLEDRPSGIISGNTIRDVGGNGLYAKSNTTGPGVEITNNHFENTGGKAMWYSISSPFTFSGNTFTGDLNSQTIRMRGGRISDGTTTTLLANQTYVFLDDGTNQAVLEIERGGTLIVEEGAILKFDKFRGIRQDGHMELRGTEENPVILTSALDDTAGGDTNNDGNTTTPAPGDWMSIWIRDTFLSQAGLATGIFENIEVRYAGLEPVGSGGTGTPAILLDGGTFEMKNVSILDSFDVGFRSRHDVGEATIDGMTIIGSPLEAINLEDGTIHLNNITIDEIDGAPLDLRMGSLDFTLDNLVVGENVPSNRTRVTGNTRTHIVLGHTPLVVFEDRFGLDWGTGFVPSSITILPGTVVKIAPSAPFVPVIMADGRGHLILNGEPGRPIIITSLLDDSIFGDTNGDGNTTSPAPGDWDGIFLSDPNSQLNHVEVRYSKSVELGHPLGAFYTISVNGLHLHDIEGNALELKNPLNVDISNSLFYDFEGRGILAQGNGTSSATFRNNTIYGGTNSIEIDLGEYTS
jgi:parallel beta-helix repeat protein